uniref:NIF system FeS cluster assembly NifU C-terminal domain-containing protein n=1 Tax=Araucaria cunninghamii TaxID=56994 RepID=A0A0D6QVR1_ARACU
MASLSPSACKVLSTLRRSAQIPLLSPTLKPPFYTSSSALTTTSKTPNLCITRAQNPSGQPLRTAESLTSVVTDETIPEGHAGLHGFLYGDKGAELHSLQTQQITAKAGEDDGSSIIPFQAYVSARDNLKFGGVYAIYDTQDQIQYVGYSRNVVLSLISHLERVGPSRCCSVRVKLFTDSSILSRGKLEEEKTRWLEVYGVPPGNSVNKELWESGKGIDSVRAMSEKERKEYEEKKLKLRKAMGENLYDDVEGEDEDSRLRRLNLLSATEGDDWSGVIDGQTKETLQQGDPQNSNVVSPFSGNGNENSKSGLYSAATYDLTAQNVDLVLNDVRPYLIADGGNVEVSSVEDGVVSLRLQGACGTCASSTTTMKMGIERVLKEKFGDALREIRQVDQQDMSATVASVNSHLDMLRPAIHNYGGSVEVLSIEAGDCHVKYNGPGPIGMGIKAAIKDKFPDIKNVVLVNS